MSWRRQYFCGQLSLQLLKLDPWGGRIFDTSLFQATQHRLDKPPMRPDARDGAEDKLDRFLWQFQLLAEECRHTLDAHGGQSEGEAIRFGIQSADLSYRRLCSQLIGITKLRDEGGDIPKDVFPAAISDAWTFVDALRCERCGIDPIVEYGTFGEACIEVHHQDTQVKDMQPSHSTKLAELQCLCANCHRIVHRELKPQHVGLSGDSDVE